MAKLHTRHTIALQAQRSRIPTVIIFSVTQASEDFPPPRLPTWLHDHQDAPELSSSFFFKCANLPSANCICPKWKMYFFKLQNVKNKRRPRCSVLGGFQLVCLLRTCSCLLLRHQSSSTGDPGLLCTPLLPLLIRVQRLGKQPHFFSLVLLDFWAFLSLSPDAWK